MKQKKKILIITAALLVAVLVTLTVVISIPKKSLDYSLLDDKVSELPKYSDKQLSTDNTVVLGTVGGMQLIYQRDIKAFHISNTAAGSTFTSGVNPSHYTSSGDAATDISMYTLCQVGYTDFLGTQDVFDTNSATCKINEKALENGIALEIKFTDYGISFTLEVWLNDNGMKARIPVDSIKEEDRYGITSIAIFPMMGAVKNTDEGFIVYPEGSGSLYKFGKNQNTTPVSTAFYFQNSFDLDEIDERIYQGRYNVMLPAYGITDGKTGVVSYVTEADENAYVTLQPALSESGYNRISASCMYRKSYSYVTPADVQITEVERNLSAGDFSIQYFFMNSNANTSANISYGDMATVVRDYMLNVGLLNKDSDNIEDIKANLQIVMATKGNSGMDTSLKSLTSFDEVKKIINAVEKDSRDNLRIYMLGWQQGGYGLNPSGDKVANILGSKGDLTELNKYLKDNKVESYMVADYVAASNEGIGFNENRQAVYNEMDLPITNAAYDSYLLNGLVELKKYIDKRLSYFVDVNANGVAFEKFGYYLYDDYGKGGKLTRAETASSFLKTAKVTAEKGIKTAVQGGNAYMLSTVNAIYDMPEKGSDDTAMAYSIPFYQMVVHGYIPYTGNVSGNMAADFEQQKLKWIEYGSQPGFVLTYNSSELLKNTYAEDAFATDYEEYIAMVNECIKEFNTKLGFTAKETMTDHKVISDDIVIVTYESGKSIYINYSEESVNVNGVEIPAENYVVKGGSAQ